MWNISKAANRRTKLTKIWAQATTVHICRLLFMPDCLVWGNFRNATPSTEFNQPSHKVS